MSTYQAVKTINAVAGSAVTIYRFVVRDAAGDGKYDHVSGADERMDGIAAESVPTDEDVFPMVIPNGTIVKVEAGAAVTAGDTVASDNVGRVITASTGVGNYTAGIAQTAAGGAGEIIEIQFIQDLDQVA
jgi:hypothetical protein